MMDKPEFVKEWNEHPLRSRKDEEMYWYTRFKEQQARAEKAEKELVETLAKVTAIQARVAELEALCERAALLMPDDSQWFRDWRGRSKAREREASNEG